MVREIYTDEDSKEFSKPKEIAMEKLFESESAKRREWVLLGKITMGYMSNFIAKIFVYILMLLRVQCHRNTSLFHLYIFYF